MSKFKTDMSWEASYNHIMSDSGHPGSSPFAWTARASETIQRIVDQVGEINDFSQAVPDAIKIVARALNTEVAGFFDVSDEGIVRLRYWLVGDNMMTAEELLANAEWGHHDTPRALVRGFEVPDGYLAVPLGIRSKPMIIDHLLGTVMPQNDEWLIEHHCPMELNIPIMMRGRDAGTLCLLRGIDDAFTQDDVDLAETLVKPLALTVEISRLGQMERDAAVAIEREKWATLRANELKQRNQTLVEENTRLRQNLSDDFAERAAATIDRHLESGDRGALTIAALAKDAGYSTGHFSTLFRASFKVSPYSYVLERRLFRARAQLLEGKSVTWVSQECGFFDHAHFSRRFKKFFGYRPSEVHVPPITPNT